MKIDLKPICKLKSKITFLKEVAENTSIGYSRSYITTKKTKVATIPIGYADGLRRTLFEKGEVIINCEKEEVTEYGETDKKIDAPIKSKKGFVDI